MCRGNRYRVKISAIPAITTRAPPHAPAAGRCPVRSQMSGRMITGDVAESVETGRNSNTGAVFEAFSAGEARVCCGLGIQQWSALAVRQRCELFRSNPIRSHFDVWLKHPSQPPR